VQTILDSKKQQQLVALRSDRGNQGVAGSPDSFSITPLSMKHTHKGDRQSFAFQAAEAALVAVAERFSSLAGPPGG